ncbi:hypothetical protein OSTOST_04711 [Ostertagia ostertagi]
MLFAFAVLPFLLTDICAHECQCDFEGEKTTCRIPMGTTIRGYRNDLEWDSGLEELARKQGSEHEHMLTPKDHKEMFSIEFFEGENINRTMEEKIRLTLNKDDNFKSMVNKCDHFTRFGCYCDYGVGIVRHNMIINCFFK